MSRVAIKDLFWEISRDKHANDVWDAYKDIEVVPRKMVEMIIEKCAGDASGPKPSEYIAGVSTEANCIKSYAELLLHEFENGKI